MCVYGGGGTCLQKTTENMLNNADMLVRNVSLLNGKCRKLHENMFALSHENKLLDAVDVIDYESWEKCGGGAFPSSFVIAKGHDALNLTK